MKKINLILTLLLMVGITNSEADKPPRSGSYIYVKVTEKESGKNIEKATLKVVEKSPEPYNIYDREYEIKASNLPEKVPFTMPPEKVTAHITAIIPGYKESKPLIITSNFYWDNVPNENGYFLEHIFEVEK